MFTAVPAPCSCSSGAHRERARGAGPLHEPISGLVKRACCAPAASPSHAVDCPAVAHHILECLHQELPVAARAGAIRADSGQAQHRQLWLKRVQHQLDALLRLEDIEMGSGEAPKDGTLLGAHAVEVAVHACAAAHRGLQGYESSQLLYSARNQVGVRG